MLWRGSETALDHKMSADKCRNNTTNSSSKKPKPWILLKMKELDFEGHILVFIIWIFSVSTRLALSGVHTSAKTQQSPYETTFKFTGSRFCIRICTKLDSQHPVSCMFLYSPHHFQWHQNNTMSRIPLWNESRSYLSLRRWGTRGCAAALS